MSALANRPFVKMNGLGNEIVVVDMRRQPAAISAADARAAAQPGGAPYDQLMALYPPRTAGTDSLVRIYNNDGSEAGACGNATRCVASVVMDERKTDQVIVQTISGLLESQKVGDGANGLPVISVDMGLARLDWRDIPVAGACDTNHLPVGAGPLQDPVGTNVGNPHATFFVEALDTIPLAELGPKLERDPFFPERANIGVVQVMARDKLKLRVWERGAGLTLACGSGACAAVVAASRRGLVDRKADVVLEQGTLGIEWLRDDHVMMTGGIALAFKGEL